MNAIRMMLVIGVVALLGACAPPAPDTEKMIEAARALDQRFIAAFNKGDVDAVMATYANTPDLVSYAPDAMEAVGWQAVKDGYAKSFAQMPGAKLELTQANYKVAGDMVIGYGKWKMTAPTPDGQTSEAFGRYTDVKTSRDGKWVYLLDHASVPFAPPAATPPPSAEPAPAAPGG